VAVAVSKEPAVAALLPLPDGTLLFYTAQGAFAVDPGQTTLRSLGAVDLAGLSRAAWSAGGERVATSRETDLARLVGLYDYATRQGRSLSSDVREIVLNSDGGRVAFHERNAEGTVNQISVSDFGGENQKILLKTRVGFWRLFWPHPERLYIVSEPSGLARGTAFLINPETGALKKVLSANGLVINPSPTGGRLLFSRAESAGKGIELLLLDTERGAERNLTQEFGVHALAEKCAWLADDRTIICAAPTKSPADALMPDDYYQGTFSSPENLVMINLDTSEYTDIQLSQTYDIQAPAADAREERLFFINRIDGLLYALGLPQNQ
jgi:Tol biopolymer transport system component